MRVRGLFAIIRFKIKSWGMDFVCERLTCVYVPGLVCSVSSVCCVMFKTCKSLLHKICCYTGEKLKKKKGKMKTISTQTHSKILPLNCFSECVCTAVDRQASSYMCKTLILYTKNNEHRNLNGFAIFE